MRILEFTGKVSGRGDLHFPGRDKLHIKHDDWPEAVSPGTLRVALIDNHFPDEFRAAFIIPQRFIGGNPVTPTSDDATRGFARVWGAKLEVNGRRAFCWLARIIGLAVAAEVDLVAEKGIWERMNLSDGMEVKVVVFEGEPPKQLTPQDFIKEKCDAARHVLEEYGDESAMGYLIGEKFLNFLEVAERDQEWREAIPAFVTAIKSIFEGWRLAQFLETPRRLGTLGHVADEDSHRMFREQMEPDEIVREDARNLQLFEWAKELLTEETP